MNGGSFMHPASGIGRAIVLIAFAAIPIILIRPACLRAIAYKDSLRPVGPPTPNPAKAPPEFLGMQEILVYAHPRLAGIFPIFMVPGIVALAATAFWARRARNWVSLVVFALLSGMLLILPWLISLLIILAEPISPF